MGFIAGATALLVPGDGPGAPRVLAYYDINATLIAAVWIVTVLATARMTRRRPWDAAMVALAPGIVLAGTINWDMWAVGLLAVGMYFFARNKPVLAGICIGLGTATKLYPLLILGAVLLLALRTGRIRAFVVTAGAAAAAWLAVNLPVAALNPEGWKYFYQFTEERPAGYSSPWFAYNLVAGRLGWAPLQADAINALALNLFLLACVLIAVLALTAPRRPRLAQLAFLIIAAFILTNKVYSPQFVLWLIPLLALARPAMAGLPDLAGHRRPALGCRLDVPRTGDQRRLLPAQYRHALLRPGRGLPHARHRLPDGAGGVGRLGAGVRRHPPPRHGRSPRRSVRPRCGLAAAGPGAALRLAAALAEGPGRCLTSPSSAPDPTDWPRP